VSVKEAQGSHLDMTSPGHLATSATVVLSLTLSAGALKAIYMRPDLENVPVARLVANLERDLAADPKNADIHLRLARLYAMAYAANADELPVKVVAGRSSPANPEVWFGHEPNLVPTDIPPGTPRTAASKAYLQKSVDHYKAVVELAPSGLVGRIGYGWTLEQSGNRAGAIAEYRRVIEQAWPKEQNARNAQLGERFYTEEAARYLIPLLDQKGDAAEIAELQKRMATLARLPRPITPIAIPLSDEATVRTIIDLDAAVPFDADGSGRQRAWTWISSQAGWLVYDASGRGQITSALQWFGDSTFWTFWKNGYEALQALDDTRDGELRGAELRHLAIWHDVNRNGRSERGEVLPLARHGIEALSCRFQKGDGIYTAAWSDAGVRFGGGRTRPTYDVILRTAVSVSAPEPQ
jgi:tetratricopeptide (TPR) repeat protein